MPLCHICMYSLYAVLVCPGPVIAFGRSVGEDKILFGCQDGTLVLYDDYTKLTHLSNSSLVSVVPVRAL